MSIPQSPASSLRLRDLLVLAGTGMAALSLTKTAARDAQDETWNKVFPKSNRVARRKVSYSNHFGILVSADLYAPAGLDTSHKNPALVVAHPFGRVKEQTSGLYAQTLADRGFVTLAFDASYNRESGGEPRQIAAAETWIEDFSASADFLGRQEIGDRDRIGLLGICGGGASDWPPPPSTRASAPWRPASCMTSVRAIGRAWRRTSTSLSSKSGWLEWRHSVGPRLTLAPR